MGDSTNGLVTAAAGLIHDGAGRVLLIQQNYGRRRWGLPGGRVNSGETPVHAVIREVRMETGLETAVIDLVGLYHLCGGDDGLPEQLTYAFRCEVVGGEASVNLPSKVAHVGWYDPRTLPSPTTPSVPIVVPDSASGRSGVVRDIVRAATPAPV
ncbi:MAG: ADP-ribose pyrophosphatase [Pseudonocardiales bacterium]|nr:MAG: ADP-ribose pyrophosphatase [Pseudonocardiales bacterium]